MRKYLFIAALVLASVHAGHKKAHAASVKLCYDDASVSPGVVSIAAIFHPSTGNDVTLPDVLFGSSVTATTRCSTQPLPSLLVRGATYGVTLVAANALGEVGLASNAVTFSPPSVPGKITGVSVQLVVP